VENLSNEGVKTQLSKLVSDTSLIEKVASLKNTLLRRKECLSHGLLGTASIAVKDGEVKVKTSHCIVFLV
jgi:5-methylthioribose kinase